MIKHMQKIWHAGVAMKDLGGYDGLAARSGAAPLQRFSDVK
jgi:hypothetical protein